MCTCQVEFDVIAQVEIVEPWYSSNSFRNKIVESYPCDAFQSNQLLSIWRRCLTYWISEVYVVPCTSEVHCLHCISVEMIELVSCDVRQLWKFVDQMWKSFAKLCLGALDVDSSVIWSLVSILFYLPICASLSWIDVTEYDWVAMPLSWLSFRTSKCTFWVWMWEDNPVKFENFLTYEACIGCMLFAFCIGLRSMLWNYSVPSDCSSYQTQWSCFSYFSWNKCNAGLQLPCLQCLKSWLFGRGSYHSSRGQWDPLVATTLYWFMRNMFALYRLSAT